ncbi:Homeodomain-like protein [Cynara cardunculus var. scolymus]|uniref:Homeodomain-like protein n=1 Tax=Cynara cardunculus var. scolymus TaxID=59895 RepID=A0A103XJT5_CYNCS|nr:Homeodomain-like protein [Cynara cardunculus var. scolymus]
MEHLQEHGPNKWNLLLSKGVLKRTEKSRRLRWLNNLQSNLKKGMFSGKRKNNWCLIYMQSKYGTNWVKIATYLPGRSVYHVKNIWYNHQKSMAQFLSLKKSLKEKQQIGREDTEHGLKKWNLLLSKGVLKHTTKSCRFWWFQHNLKKVHAQLGKIATYLSGRSVYHVKNVWYNYQKSMACLTRV